MTFRIGVFIAAMVTGLTSLGVAAAVASEQFAEGTHVISVPGVGAFEFAVAADGTITLVAVPGGYTVPAAGSSDEIGVTLTGTGLPTLKVEIEEGEFELQGLPVVDGTYLVTVPGIGEVTVTVGGGRITAVGTLPAGFTAEIDEDGESVLITAPAGSGYEISIDGNELSVKVVEVGDDVPDDDESDDHSQDVRSDDDESDDEVEMSGQESEDDHGDIASADDGHGEDD